MKAYAPMGDENAEGKEEEKEQEEENLAFNVTSYNVWAANDIGPISHTKDLNPCPQYVSLVSFPFDHWRPPV